MTRKFPLLVAASLILTTTIPAISNATEEVATMRVKIGDLDLRSKAGATAAFNRIVTQSKAFCGVDYGRTNMIQRAAATACLKRMTYMAVAKLDAPMVTAQYDGSGASPPIRFAQR